MCHSKRERGGTILWIACNRDREDNNSIYVTALTSAVACHVGGTTIHKEFRKSVKDILWHEDLRDGKKQQMMKKLKWAIALIFD
jgi:hypothetical protein